MAQDEEMRMEMSSSWASENSQPNIYLLPCICPSSQAQVSLKLGENIFVYCFLTRVWSRWCSQPPADFSSQPDMCRKICGTVTAG